MGPYRVSSFYKIRRKFHVAGDERTCIWQILIVFDKDEDPVFCQPRGKGISPALQRPLGTGTVGRICTPHKINIPLPRIRKFVVLSLLHGPAQPGIILVMYLFFSRVQIDAHFFIRVVSADGAAGASAQFSAVIWDRRNSVQQPVDGLPLSFGGSGFHVVYYIL